LDWQSSHHSGSQRIDIGMALIGAAWKGLVYRINRIGSALRGMARITYDRHGTERIGLLDRH
jgi:hypothetical protein